MVWGGPFKLYLLLSEHGKWFGNFGKYFYELPVVSN